MYNDINSGAIKIAKMLSSNTSLHTLNLENNCILQDDINEIAQILESNYSLTEVKLSYNNMILEPLLKRNKTVVENKRFKKTKSARIKS